MGLTSNSTGISAVDSGLKVKKRSPDDKVIAVAGNPNVGKSTLFNALTGMKQHTGNWPGKTVSNAQGYCKNGNRGYVLVDIPGTYSLLAHSPEEEIARNFICFGKPDAVVIVCDATCLERNLNLVLQILEITDNAIVCVNLLDEAQRKGISINLSGLSERLGVKVVGTVARQKKTLKALLSALDEVTDAENTSASFKIHYPEPIERAIGILEPVIKERLSSSLSSRWLSLKLLENDSNLNKEIIDYLGINIFEDEIISKALSQAFGFLYKEGFRKNSLREAIASSAVCSAEVIFRETVTERHKYSTFDIKADKILTSRKFGYPIMLLLLMLIFWITIFGANYISDILSYLFACGERLLEKGLSVINATPIIRDFVINGIYRVPSWVIAVMLPPMAVFFPLFTILEDIGYLPRIAYNLDKPFKRCNSCGKQALTMCMGFGCNAAGVIGCRIIDSKREKLLAIITNSLVPCNGRFPAIIAIITMFFVKAKGFLGSLLTAVILTAVITLGIIMTFLSTKILSKTLLKGEPSSYTLEIPPFRKPKIGSVIVRSVFDRTLFVLARSVAVAVPAGIIIWLVANINIYGSSLLSHSARILDPMGRMMGLDGVILIAFILGFPANEIVLPIAIMTYLSAGSLSDAVSTDEMRRILLSNGWDTVTALCTVIFSLMHWPCSTTMLTIKKESGSIKWTLVSFLFPTLLGFIICTAINLISKLL